MSCIRFNRVKVTVSSNEVTASAINSTVTTDAIKVEGGLKFDLAVVFTRSAATAVTVTPQISHDNTTWLSLQSFSDSSGTVTCNDVVFTKAVSGNKNFHCGIELPATAYIRWLVAGTGADANDTVALTGYMVKA